MAGLDLGTVYATARLRTDALSGDVGTATGLVQGFGQELERIGNIAFGVAIGQQLDDIIRRLQELPRSLVQANAAFESFSAGVAAMFDVAARQPVATAQQASAFADAQLTQQNQRLAQAQARAQDIEANHAAAVQRLGREQQEGEATYARALRNAAQQQQDVLQDQSRASAQAAQDRVLHDRDAQQELTRQLADYNQRWAEGAQERQATFTRTLDTLTQRHGETLGRLGEELNAATAGYHRQLGDLEAVQQATLGRFRDEAAQTVEDAGRRVQDVQQRLHDQVRSLQLSAQRSQVEYSFQVQDIESRLAGATRPAERATAQRDLARAQVLHQLRLREEQLRLQEAQETAQRETQQAQREEARRLAALQRQEAQERASTERRRADLAASFQQREQQLTTAIARENTAYARQTDAVHQQFAEREAVATASYNREVANAQAAYQHRVEIDARAWDRQAADRQVHLQRAERDYAQMLVDLADRFHERQVRLDEEATNAARTYASEQRKALESVAEAQQKLATERNKLEEGVLEQGRMTATMFTADWIKATNAVAEAHGRRGVFRPPEGIDDTVRDMDKARQVFEALLQVERQVPVPLRDLQTAFQQLLGAGIDPFKNDLIVTVAELSKLPQVRGGITEVARAFQELAAGAPGQAERVFRQIGLPLERVPGLVRNAQGHIEGFIDANGRLNTSTAALFDRVAAHIGELGTAIARRQEHTFATLTSTLETMAYQFQLIAGKELFGRLEDDIRAFIGWMDDHKSEVAAAGATLGNALAGGLETAVGALRQLGDPIVLANLGQLAGAAGELGGSLIGLAGGLKDVAFAAGGDGQAAKALGLFNDVMGDLGHGQIDAAQAKLNDFGIDLHQIADLKWDAQGNLLTPIEEASGPIHDAIYERMYRPAQQVADTLKDVADAVRAIRQAVAEATPGIAKDFGDLLELIKQVEAVLNHILQLEHDLGNLLRPGRTAPAPATDVAREAGSYATPAEPRLGPQPSEAYGGALGPTTLSAGSAPRGLLPQVLEQVRGLGIPLPQYATGGPITRRTWLVDAQTGQIYAEAGEAGPEDVTPRRGAGRGAQAGGLGGVGAGLDQYAQDRAAQRQATSAGRGAFPAGQHVTPPTEQGGGFGLTDANYAAAQARRQAEAQAQAAANDSMAGVYQQDHTAFLAAERQAAEQLKGLQPPGRATYALGPGSTALNFQSRPTAPGAEPQYFPGDLPPEAEMQRELARQLARRPAGAGGLGGTSGGLGGFGAGGLGAGGLSTAVTSGLSGGTTAAGADALAGGVVVGGPGYSGPAPPEVDPAGLDEARRAGVQALQSGDAAYKGSGLAAFGGSKAAVVPGGQAAAQSALAAYTRPFGAAAGDTRAVGAAGAYNAVQAAALGQNAQAAVPPAAYQTAGTMPGPPLAPSTPAPGAASAGGQGGISIGGSLTINQADSGLLNDVVSQLRRTVEAG